MHFLSQEALTFLQGWPIFCQYPERCSGLSPFAPLALPGEPDAEVHDSL
jgi:hypothetical protein